jgi:hypothetical protein
MRVLAYYFCEMFFAFTKFQFTTSSVWNHLLMNMCFVFNAIYIYIYIYTNDS